MPVPESDLQQLQFGIAKYYQRTTKEHAKVLQNLIVQLGDLAVIQNCRAQNCPHIDPASC